VGVAGTAVTTVDELAAALESADGEGAVEVVVVRGVDDVTLAVDLTGRGATHEGSA
jgi:S1-C subfamily serine protease